MKLITSLSLLALSLIAVAGEPVAEKSANEKWRRRCECSVTDWDRGHYYGSSNVSAEEATARAFRDCYSRTQSPGTCEVANYDFCGCRY